MKHCVFVLAILGFALSSPAAAQTYHFRAYIFGQSSTRSPANVHPTGDTRKRSIGKLDQEL